MENAPVMFFHGIKPPDATRDIEKRYEKWFEDAYVPLMLPSPGLARVEQYKIVPENSNYPKELTLWYFDSLINYEEM
jgi:hypothetical protein